MATELLEKPATISRTYNFEFSKRLAVGETITSVVSITCDPAGLTFTSGVIAGSIVQTRITGGVVGQVYDVLCKVGLSTGDGELGCGNLLVVLC